MLLESFPFWSVSGSEGGENSLHFGEFGAFMHASDSVTFKPRQYATALLIIRGKYRKYERGSRGW